MNDPLGVSEIPIPSQDQAFKLRQEAQKESDRKTFNLHEYSQHKHSVRYNCNIPDAPASSVYVNRSTWPRMPKSIRVTIEPIY